ncbi:MAG: hypothetical protein IJU64_04110 [Bacilli bacterium]|nr:hypothetical protein [Bacilli bacterium]
MFTGRREELKELKSRFETNRLEVVLVSGKRRIGKSQLIVEAQKSFPGIIISYECFRSSYETNLRMLEAEIRKVFGNDYLHFGSLFEVLSFLHEQAAKTKVLFVLDEYPYMREGEATDSEIKNALDRINALDATNPLKVVLCGSAIEVMNLLDESNKPLFGRFTSRIHVGPLTYLESASFYPNASLEDKIAYYCVMGGIPYYLKQVDDRLSFDENIVRLFFSSNPLLKTELEAQINNEVAKIEKAAFVLGIIKDKTISYSDILGVFNAAHPNKSIDYVLDRLKEIDAIEKVRIEQNNGRNKPYYQIKDNAMKFFFSYLNAPFGNRLLFSDMDYYRTFVEENLKKKYIPHMFEKVGLEFVAAMNRKNLLPDRLLDIYPFTINDKKTKKNYQFDVVGETKEGRINYECKFKDVPVAKTDAEKESRQAELANENFIKTVFISKTKILDPAVESFGLPDMFSDRLLG